MAVTRMICLNADLGELPGKHGRQLDRELLTLVSRCSVACGGHAGDEETMEATLLAAKRSKVSVGAHPSYPDRQNFGRIDMVISAKDLRVALEAQVLALSTIANRLGVRLDHLKPHGALYNAAAKDLELAQIVVEITQAANIPALMGPPTSQLTIAALEAGLAYIPEGFIDRLYLDDGSLAPRSDPRAVISDTTRRVVQANELVTKRSVTAQDGSTVQLNVATLCVHGDTVDAIETIKHVRTELSEAGIVIGVVGA